MITTTIIATTMITTTMITTTITKLTMIITITKIIEDKIDNNDHLADELGVINDVELLPGEQLFPTDKAGETFQVENLR